MTCFTTRMWWRSCSRTWDQVIHKKFPSFHLGLLITRGSHSPCKKSNYSKTCKLWGSSLERIHDERERERPTSLSCASHSSSARHVHEINTLYVLSLASSRGEDSGNLQQPETLYTYGPSNLGCSNHPSWDPSHWAEISHPAVSFPSSWHIQLCIE